MLCESPPRKMVWSALLVLFSGVCGLQAQLSVEQIQDLNELGPPRRLVSLTAYPVGSEVGGILRAWGIELSGPGSHVVRRVRQTWQPPLNVLPIPGESVFSNESVTELEASAGRPLVLTFRHPVRRIEFSLANGNGDTSMSIRALDPWGFLLGEEGLDHHDEALGLPWRVSTDSVDGIALLVVDYGDAPQPEQLWLWSFDFIEDPKFELYVPQVASGRIDSSEALQTELVILGLSDTGANGTVEFLNAVGQPLEMDLLGLGPTNSVSFTGLRTRLRLETNPDSADVASGYVRISSDAPVTASAAFRVVRDGRVLSQAGITAVESARRQRTYLRFSPGTAGVVGPTDPFRTLDTGLAFANGSDEEVTVTLILRNLEGRASSANPIQLEPRGHFSAFASELFGLASYDTGFVADLLITGSGPVAVTVLETIDGRVLSSLPAASLLE